MSGSDPIPPSSKDLGITRQAGGPEGETDGVPAQLGPYRLIRKLGGGGMGQIFLAVQPNVGREVAIKVLPQGAIAGDEAVERFRREVHILGQLSHPHICPVLEAGEDRGILYYVMERLRGLDLARVLRTQRVDARRATAIAIQVARALQCAHERGIVHRDVKPQNVMLLRGERLEKSELRASRPGTGLGSALRRLFGRTVAAGEEPVVGEPAEDEAGATDPSPEFRDHAVLIDFGLARDGGAGGERLTITGAVMGTPAYMAPEQARGDVRAIGPATDVYAAGILLYEMLTLQPPFTGDTVGDVLERVRTTDPPPMRHINPRVDRDLETIVQKAMEKDPERRFESAAALAEDLERWRAGEPIQARRASLGYRVAKRVRRNPLASAALAALVSVMAAGLSYFLRPGEIELTGDVEGAEIFLGSARKRDTLLTVWPVWPGSDVEVVVRLAGVEDRHTVAVAPGARVEVPVRLFGDLKIDTDPPGAAVSCDGVVLPLRTPFTFPVLKGLHKLHLVLPNHDVLERAAEIRPGTTFGISATFEHQRGRLTLTSDPGESAIELTPHDGGTRVLLAAPAVDAPVRTGRYHGVARARNRFPRAFDLELRDRESVALRFTLPEIALWERGTAPLGLDWLAEDLDDDGRPEIVCSTSGNGRVWVLDGEDGALLWTWSDPEIENRPAGGLEAADLDGDMRPEVLVAAERPGIEVLDGLTGRLLRKIPAERASAMAVFGDWDGDGGPDVLAILPSGIAAFSGRTGARLWQVAKSAKVVVAPARLAEDGTTDVVMAGRDDGVKLIEGRTGRVLWSADVSAISGAVAIDADGDGKDEIFAYLRRPHEYRLWNGRDGSVRWSKAAGTYSLPVRSVAADVDDDGLPEILQGSEHHLRILDSRTGEIRLEAAMRAGDAPPVVADATGDGKPEILLPSGSVFVALDAATLAERWRFESDSVIESAALLADFDGDGRQDAAVRSNRGTVSVLCADRSPLVWRQGSPHDGGTGPVPLGPDRLFVPGLPNRVLRARDGAVESEPPLDPAFWNCLARAPGGPRLVLDGFGTCRMLDAQNFGLVWSVPSVESEAPLLAADLNGDGADDIVRGTDTHGGDLEALDGRSGDVLWKADVARPERTTIAWTEGLVWVPSRGVVVALRASDGAEVERFLWPGVPSSVISVGSSVYAGGEATGKILRIRTRKGKKSKIEWIRVGVAPMTKDSPVASGGTLACASYLGEVAALDAKSGKLLWKVLADEEITAAPALADLDGDGAPEVAVVGDTGRVAVLSGVDGTEIRSWRLAASLATKPAWHDVDGDGRPELLVVGDDSRLNVLSMEAPSGRSVYRLRSWQHGTTEVARASVRGRLLLRIAAARSRSRWDEIVRLARDAPDGTAAAKGALAAVQAGDSREAFRLGETARALGVRRLEVAIARCANMPVESDRAPALAKALLEAPARSFDHFVPLDAPPDLLAAASRSAARTAASESEWERALALCLHPDTWPLALEIFEAAVAAGADRAAMLLHRGKTASHLARYEDARADFAAAAKAGRAIESAAGLAALERLAADLGEKAYAASLRRDNGAALRAARAASAVGTSDPWILKRLAECFSSAGSFNRDDWQRGIDCAERALRIVDATADGDVNTRSHFVETLARCLYASNQKERAYALIEEALQTPLNPARHTELEQTLRHLKQAFGE